MGANPEPTKTPTRAAAVRGSSINAALASSSIFLIEHLCHSYLQFYCQTVTDCYARGYSMLRFAVRLRTTTAAGVEPLSHQDLQHAWLRGALECFGRLL